MAKEKQNEIIDTYYKKWSGVNSSNPESTIEQDEMPLCENFEIFPNYLKTRNGMSLINGKDYQIANGDSQQSTIYNHIVWDTGTDEYLLYQTNTKIFYAKLEDGYTHQTVKLKSDGVTDLTIDSNGKIDFCLANNNLYCFSKTSLKNFIIEYDSQNQKFLYRQMGLNLPVISSFSNLTGGLITGSYVYAVEFVYRKSGETFDTIASTPNRKQTDGAIGSVLAEENKIQITVSTPTDTLYTHVRLWRSKRLDQDTLNNQLVDITGTESELYPIELITKAQFINGAGYTNKDGTAVGQYKFIDNTPDTELPVIEAGAWYNFVDISKIELQPMGSYTAKLGTYHNEKIWIIGTDNDITESRAFYSNYSGTPYSEQFSTSNFKDIERTDGQKVTGMIAFEKDLVFIKESKTYVLPNGDPDLLVDCRDHNVGVKSANLMKYVSGFGIIAITSDNYDVKLFDYGFAWSNKLSSTPSYNKIRDKFESANLDYITMDFFNGKLYISDGYPQPFGYTYINVLNINNGSGWSIDKYYCDNLSKICTYNNKSRLMFFNYLSSFAGNINLIHRLKDPSSTVDYFAGEPINYYGEIKTSQFKIEDGRKIVRINNLSIIANLYDNLSVKPFVNGIEWDSYKNIIVDVNNYNNRPELKQNEYKMFFENKPIGNFISFQLKTRSPATIHNIQINATQINGNNINFDPFEVRPYYKELPNYGSNVIHYSQYGNSYDILSTISHVKDLSGKERHLEYYNNGTGGEPSINSQNTLNRLFSIEKEQGTNSFFYNTWNGLEALEAIKNKAFTVEVIFKKITQETMTLIEFGDGTSYFRLMSLEDNSFEAQCFHNGVNKKYKASPLSIIDDLMILQLTISNGGNNGQFFFGYKSGICTALTTTTSNLI